MPWLEKDNNGDYTDDADDGHRQMSTSTSTSMSNTTTASSTTSSSNKQLLFIHVPRCGGTSLMKSHNIPYKATHHAKFYRKVGMKIFFHRYKLLETANFPIWTYGNALCVWMILSTIYVRLYYDIGGVLPIAMTTFSIVFFSLMIFGLTFIFVAPTIGRIIYIRRFFLVSVEYILWGAMENIEYLTGTNIHGYLPHLTAHKMLSYGYVTPLEMKTVSSLAIVRNPYSRMVSVYMYNRFGSQETFHHFVHSWYQNMKYYREEGEMEEWYTPCHVLPQFEYTHFEGYQLVQSIVKQEELKYLKYKNNDNDTTNDTATNEDKNNDINDNTNSIRDLPQVVKNALLNMPHANKRKTTKPWYEYYDQETLNMTHDMYQLDFEIFQYSTVIPQRPDLHCPPSITNINSLSQSVSKSMMVTTQQQQQQLQDDDPQPQPQLQSAVKAILFESFSRNTAAVTSNNSTSNNSNTEGNKTTTTHTTSTELMESERRRHRNSLITKSVRVSARRSSMIESVRSTRNVMFHKEEENVDGVDVVAGQKKNE